MSVPVPEAQTSTLRRIFQAIEPHPRKHYKDKAIAVGLALMVWVGVNADEAVPGFVNDVVVVLDNMPAELALAADYQQTVQVRVRGPQRSLDNITPGRLSPRIDLSDAQIGENVFTISGDDIGVPSGVTVENVEPSQIIVVLDAWAEKTVPISPVTSGEPSPGYGIVGRSTEPATATASGPAALINSLERIETNTVDVRRHSETFTQLVALDAGSSFVSLGDKREVEMTIEILEDAVPEDFEGVPIEVVNARYRVVVNPQSLRVTLQGPPSLLAQIDLDALRLVIDAAELEPRDEDYRIAPTIDFGQDGLAEHILVVTMSPQRAVDVRVFPQPSRR